MEDQFGVPLRESEIICQFRVAAERQMREPGEGSAESWVGGLGTSGRKECIL